jgi:hypothetical protein
MRVEYAEPGVKGQRFVARSEAKAMTQTKANS